MLHARPTSCIAPTRNVRPDLLWWYGPWREMLSHAPLVTPLAAPWDGSLSTVHASLSHSLICACSLGTLGRCGWMPNDMLVYGPRREMLVYARLFANFSYVSTPGPHTHTVHSHTVHMTVHTFPSDARCTAESVGAHVCGTGRRQDAAGARPQAVEPTTVYTPHDTPQKDRTPQTNKHQMVCSHGPRAAPPAGTTARTAPSGTCPRAC